MSLINDLLCDLQARNAGQSASASVNDLRPVQRPPSRRAWLWPVAGTLMAAGALALYHADKRGAAAPLAVAALASPQAGPSVAPPADAQMPAAAPGAAAQANAVPPAAVSTPLAAATPPASGPSSETPPASSAAPVEPPKPLAAAPSPVGAAAPALAAAVPPGVALAPAPPAPDQAGAVRAPDRVASAAAAGAARTQSADTSGRPQGEPAHRQPESTSAPTATKGGGHARRQLPDTVDAEGVAPPSAPPRKVRTSNPRGDGLAALAEGRAQDALVHFDEWAAASARDAQAHIYRARALAALGRTPEAEAVLVGALTTVDAPAPVARALARHLLARASNDEALKLLEAYRPRERLDAEHDAFIAAAAQRMGRHEVAAQRYRGVLAVRPEAAAWWVGLAISEEARGRGEAALSAYRHARNIGNLDPRLAAYAERRIAAMQGADRS